VEMMQEKSFINFIIVDLDSRNSK
jgi:hypothetical protein